jgi:hypothetical protein
MLECMYIPVCVRTRTWICRHCVDGDDDDGFILSLEENTIA